MTDQAAADQPVLLRVERGNPTHEELAALVTVLAARRAASAGATSSVVRPSGWTDRSRGLRAPQRLGSNGWHAAALPR